MRNPLVSIVIPVYNRRHLIAETLESIIGQTYNNWEAIIVDDGSTDGTTEHLIENYSTEDRIKIVKRNRDPKGAPTCRNIGLSIAQGKYIIFLDSDDLLEDYCLEQRIKKFQENKDLDFIVFPGLTFSDESNDRYIISSYEPGIDYCLKFLLFDAPWVIFMPMWRKASIQKNELLFDERLLAYQDMQFHLDALLKGLNFMMIYASNTFLPDSYWRVSKDNSRIGYKINNFETVMSTLNFYSRLYNCLRIRYPKKRKLYLKAIKRYVVISFMAYIRQSRYSEGTTIITKGYELNLFTKKELSVLKIHKNILMLLNKFRLIVFRKFYNALILYFTKSILSYRNTIYRVNKYD